MRVRHAPKRVEGHHNNPGGFQHVCSPKALGVVHGNRYRNDFDTVFPHHCTLAIREFPKQGSPSYIPEYYHPFLKHPQKKGPRRCKLRDVPGLRQVSELFDGLEDPILAVTVDDGQAEVASSAVRASGFRALGFEFRVARIQG